MHRPFQVGIFLKYFSGCTSNSVALFSLIFESWGPITDLNMAVLSCGWSVGFKKLVKLGQHCFKCGQKNSLVWFVLKKSMTELCRWGTYDN